MKKAILSKAKSIIENEGWCKVDFHDCQGYCMLGAVTMAVTNRKRWDPTCLGSDDLSKYTEVIEYMRNYLGGTPVSHWNDGCKSKDEVLRMFDEMIKNADS